MAAQESELILWAVPQRTHNLPLKAVQGLYWILQTTPRYSQPRIEILKSLKHDGNIFKICILSSKSLPLSSSAARQRQTILLPGPSAPSLR